MKTVLNVKTDADVKREAQVLAKHLGIPLSTVVNAYLKEFIATGELRLSREPVLRPNVALRLEKAIAEVREGKGMSPVFKTAKEAVAWLKQ